MGSCSCPDPASALLLPSSCPTPLQPCFCSYFCSVRALLLVCPCSLAPAFALLLPYSCTCPAPPLLLSFLTLAPALELSSSSFCPPQFDSRNHPQHLSQWFAYNLIYSPSSVWARSLLDRELRDPQIVGSFYRRPSVWPISLCPRICWISAFETGSLRWVYEQFLPS